MGRQERAELAVRLVGLVMLAIVGAWLLAWLTEESANLRAFGIHLPPRDLVGFFAAPALDVLIGAWLLFRPRAVSRLLIPRVPEAEDSAILEMLRLGMFALAVWFIAYCLHTAASAVFSGPLVFYCAGVDCLLAVALLWRPRPIFAWLVARTRAEAGWSIAGVLAAGISLVAILHVGNGARDLALVPVSRMYLENQLADAAAQFAAGAAGNPMAVLSTVRRASAFVDLKATLDVLWLVLALVLMALSGRLGRLLARGAPETPRPLLRELGRQGWIELALPAAVLWVICLHLTPVVAYMLRLGTAAKPLVVGLTPMVTVALVLAAGRLGPPLARLFCGRGPAGAADRGSLAMAIEVAITGIVLYQALSDLQHGIRALYVALAWYGALALLMVFRGDIALWCVGGADARGGEDVKERRQAAIYPWLVMVAIMNMLWAFFTVSMRLAMLTLVPPREPPASAGAADLFYTLLTLAVLIVGLLLVFARRPLARLLSYGPLLHGRGGVRHGLKSD